VPTTCFADSGPVILGQMSSASPSRITGKERDAETGLDYFIARHYTSAIGRFLQSDEFTGGPVDAFSSNDPAPPGPTFYADLTNPQSLNKYAYAPPKMSYPEMQTADRFLTPKLPEQRIRNWVLGRAKANRVLPIHSRASSIKMGNRSRTLTIPITVEVTTQTRISIDTTPLPANDFRKNL